MSQLILDKARLSARLQELHGEFARGESQMAEIDQRRAALRDTLLRISGAIQVLEELVEDGHQVDLSKDASNGGHPVASLSSPDAH